MKLKKYTTKTLLAGGVLSLALACSSPSGSSKWQSFSGDKNIERKVDSVLALMTLEEKIGQMSQFSANWDITGPVMPDDFQPYLEKGLVGSVFNAVTVPGVRKMPLGHSDPLRLRCDTRL